MNAQIMLDSKQYSIWKYQRILLLLQQMSKSVLIRIQMQTKRLIKKFGWPIFSWPRMTLKLC